MKCTVEMVSDGLIYVPSLMKVDLGIQVILGLSLVVYLLLCCDGLIYIAILSLLPRQFERL
jgi:hypothetical protein